MNRWSLKLIVAVGLPVGAASHAYCQPIFTRAGDSTIRNLVLQGGMFQNPMEISKQLQMPSTGCAGNNGPDTSTGALGVVCVFMSSSGKQTYLSQFGLSVPANTQNAANVGDQVALYPEARLNAFSAAGWAENPLIQANKDSGPAIASEIDLNNLSACDDAGVDTSATGGTASFTAARSDGSACSQKLGLLVAGVAGNTSAAGIAFQYVSDGSHDMWQDGIRLIGGNLIAEYEWVSNTGSATAFAIKGVHQQHAIDMSNGQFGQGALVLPNTGQGGIKWQAPSAGSSAGYLNSYDITPGADGSLHVNGAKVTTTGSLESSANLVADLDSVVKRNFYVDSITSNMAPAISVHASMTFDSGKSVTASSLEATTGFMADASAAVRGTLYVDSISSNGAGKTTFNQPIQAPLLTVSSLPTGCTAGELAYAADGRKAGEAAGAGSGTAVLCTSLQKGAAPSWVPLSVGTAQVAN